MIGHRSDLGGQPAYPAFTSRCIGPRVEALGARPARPVPGGASRGCGGIRRSGRAGADSGCRPSHGAPPPARVSASAAAAFGAPRTRTDVNARGRDPVFQQHPLIDGAAELVDDRPATWSAGSWSAGRRPGTVGARRAPGASSPLDRRAFPAENLVREKRLVHVTARRGGWCGVAGGRRRRRKGTVGDDRAEERDRHAVSKLHGRIGRTGQEGNPCRGPAPPPADGRERGGQRPEWRTCRNSPHRGGAGRAGPCPTPGYG